MTTNYPTSIQSLTATRGTSGQPLNAPNHVTHHTLEDDTIVALETKVGADSSVDTASHDYKLSEVLTATPDKAVGKAAIQTLLNKTLISPKITAGSMAKGDMLQLSVSDGTLTPVRAANQGDIISWNSVTSQWETIANPAAADATYAVKGVRVLDANAVYYGADAGSTDAYAITLSPALLAYAVGQVFTFKANTINTGAAMLNVNSLGAKTIVKGVNTALADGDIAAGQICIVEYDGTNFVLQSPSSNTISFLGKFTNGVATRADTTASGVQNIPHGLPVMPKFVRINATYAHSGSGSPFALSMGSYNGTTNSSSHIEYGGRTSGIDSINGVLMLNNTAGTGGSQVAIITYDATNIILTWTLTGGFGATDGTLINMNWEAEA